MMCVYMLSTILDESCSRQINLNHSEYDTTQWKMMIFVLFGKKTQIYFHLKRKRESISSPKDEWLQSPYTYVNLFSFFLLATIFDF